MNGEKVLWRRKSK